MKFSFLGESSILSVKGLCAKWMFLLLGLESIYSGTKSHNNPYLLLLLPKNSLSVVPSISAFLITFSLTYTKSSTFIFYPFSYSIGELV